MTDNRPASRMPSNIVVAVLSLALGVFLGGLVFSMVRLAGAAFRSSIVIAVVIAIATVIGMLCWALFVRSQAAKKALWLGIWNSTLTGSTPTGAEPDEWLPRLRSQRRFWKGMLIAAPIEFGLFSALGLFVVITGPTIWWHWAELAFFGSAGIFGYLQARRQLGRIDRAVASLYVADK